MYSCICFYFITSQPLIRSVIGAVQGLQLPGLSLNVVSNGLPKTSANPMNLPCMVFRTLVNVTLYSGCKFTSSLCMNTCTSSTIFLTVPHANFCSEASNILFFGLRSDLAYFSTTSRHLHKRHLYNETFFNCPITMIFLFNSPSTAFFVFVYGTYHCEFFLTNLFD